MRLNGLPPGEPVIGTLSLTSTGQDPQVAVNVSYPSYDAAAPYELVLEADLDGDGVLERIGGTVVVASYDGTQTVGVPRPSAVVADLRLATSPNPFFVGSAVEFALPSADDAALGVYDLSGRLVRSLHRGRLAGGAHRFEWNGRDDRGQGAPAGVYFIRLETAGRHLESKLVKLR